MTGCIIVHNGLVRMEDNKMWSVTSTIDAHDVEVSTHTLVYISKDAPWERLPVSGRCYGHGINSGFLVANGNYVD